MIKFNNSLSVIIVLICGTIIIHWCVLSRLDAAVDHKKIRSLIKMKDIKKMCHLGSIYVSCFHDFIRSRIKKKSEANSPSEPNPGHRLTSFLFSCFNILHITAYKSCIIIIAIITSHKLQKQQSNKSKRKYKSFSRTETGKSAFSLD